MNFKAFSNELVKIASANAEQEGASTRGGRGAALAAGGIAGSMAGGVAFLKTKGQKGRDLAADKDLYDRVLKQGPEGIPVKDAPGIGDNAYFKPGKGRTGEIGMGSGTKGYAPTLAHEMGHADLHRSKPGRVLQNPVTMRMGGLSANPAIGAIAGGLSAQSDNETVRRLGRWAPAIAGAPMLGYEAGASLLAMRRLRRAGANAAQMRNAAKNLAGAWGTYGGTVAMNTGIAHGVQSVATPAKKMYRPAPEQQTA